MCGNKEEVKMENFNLKVKITELTVALEVKLKENLTMKEEIMAKHGKYGKIWQNMAEQSGTWQKMPVVALCLGLLGIAWVCSGLLWLAWVCLGSLEFARVHLGSLGFT